MESMHTTEPTLPDRGRLAAMSLLTVILSGLFFLSYHDYGLAPFDEGVLMEGIRLAAEGRMDPPRFLHYSIQYDALAALFPGGDPDIEVVRLVWVIVRTLTAWLILLIGVRLLPLRWSLVPVLLFLALPGPWHKAPVAFCVCLCLHAMLRALDLGRRRDAIWLGICATAAFAIHPYTGFLCAVAWCVLVTVLGEARYGGVAGPRTPSRALAWNGLIALTFGGGLLMVISLLWRLTPFALLGQNTGLVRSIAPGSRVFAAQLQHFTTDPGVAVVLSIYVALGPIMAATLWLVWTRRGPAANPYGHAALLCVAVVGFFNLAKWVVRFDLAHLLQNAAPVWILLTVILHRATAHALRCDASPMRRARAGAPAGIIWLWAILVAGYGFTSSDTFVGGVGTRIATDTVPLAHPHGTLHVRPKLGHDLADLASIIRAHSTDGDTLLIRAIPKILHYLCQRPSPIIAPAFVFPAVFATNPIDEIVDGVRTARTPLIVYSPEPLIPIDDYRLENLAPEFHRLIQDDYRLLAEVGRIQVRIMMDSTTNAAADVATDSQPAETRKP